jgi:Carboxypeptidase regulatory-like domain
MRRLLSVVGSGFGWGGLLLLMLGGSAPANAQEKPAQMPQMNMDHRGALQGRVRDGNGAAVADATVQATSQDNGAMFTATTDAQGSYAFGALPVAKYEVSIARDGQTLFRQRDIDVTMDKTAQLDIALDAAAAAQAADFERQDLLAKIATLEQRITALESSTVLSEPETRVRRVQVFVDANGNEHDEQVPGSTPKITYRRERTYRRQTITA